MSFNPLPSNDTDWLATAGVVLSAAGIGVSFWLTQRAIRQTSAATGEKADVSVDAGFDGRLHKLAAGLRFHLSARHHKSSHVTLITVDSPPETADGKQPLDEALNELRPTYTEHEVAAYYEAMSDEEGEVANRPAPSGQLSLTSDSVATTPTIQLVPYE